jgi:hypothetical protein
VHAFAHADAPGARNERQRTPRLESVEQGTHLPSDLEHVLETGGREQKDAGPTPLEQRVGRDRRPVMQARRAAQCRDPCQDCVRRVTRRRTDLQDLDPAANDGDEIREGPAGVDADQDGRAVQDADFSLPPELGLESDFPSDFVSVFVSVFVSLFASPEAPALPSPGLSPPSLALLEPERA